jgi:DNA-directed RNA polymerase subunit RPC12/RpoP
MFENLGEKIANLGNTVAAGASNVVDNTKKGINTFSENMALKKKIETAKENKNAAFNSIGERFYNENKDAVPAGYEEIFAQVDGYNKTIADTEEEIRQLNEGVTCPKCGAKVKKGFAFCTNCGCKMGDEKKPENNMVECPNCHKSVPATSAFCNYCGTKLEKPAEEQAEAVQEKICANCGHKLDPDAAFCNMCGTPVK